MMVATVSEYEVEDSASQYEEYKDVAPYSMLQDGDWTSLRWSCNSHPNARKISHRFSDDYNEKLLWTELNEMKKEIENRKKLLREARMKISFHRRELITLIGEQEQLCFEDNRVSTLNTILLSSISANNPEKVNPEGPLGALFQQVPCAMFMMKDIISFIPLETCAQKLQKHLDDCDGTYKCTKDHVCYECQFKENGRCSHYYEIQRAHEELEIYEYYDEEDQNKINYLEYKYERALAVKENRLQEYLDDMFEY